MAGPSSPDNSRKQLDVVRHAEVLSALTDLPGVGVFTVDAEARFVSWSSGAEAITGYGAADVVGQPCHMLEGPDCKGFSGLADLLASDDPGMGMDGKECRAYSKDSRRLHLLGSVRVLRNDDGAPFGAIGTFVDLSEPLHLNAPADQTPATPGLLGLVGESAAMQEVFRRVRLAADSDVTTLITGESGTGKELAARAIHTLSDRSSSPFVAINCSAIPESLLESELFGHVKGAFTGAVRDRSGVFESAHGGTLFLDEIGDVSPLLQLKLLRVLQEREIQRVGDEGTIEVDVRLLTATNRDLAERIKSERMREDFYYRIRVFEIRMPPLRDRPDDIPVLAQYFLETVARTHGKSVKGIANDAIDALVRHPWPGNVRELQNAMEHAVVVQQGEAVGLLDLPDDVRGVGGKGRPAPLGHRALDQSQEAERLKILRALDDHGWSRTKTAESLGVSRVTLWKKIRRYGIDDRERA